MSVSRLNEIDQIIHLFIELGLSTVQARTYLTIAKNQSHPAKKIAELSGIASPDVYKTLYQLEKAGLIVKTFDQPKKYQAIPIDEILSTLLLRRSERTTQLEKEASAIIKSFRQNGIAESEVESTEFIIIPQKEALYNKIRKSVESTRESICLLGTSKKMIGGISIDFEAFKKALTRKISFRLVLPIHEQTQQSKQPLKFLLEQPTFSLRYFTGSIQSSFGIYDGQEILMSTSNTDSVGQNAALWSKNRCLVDLTQGYFDFIWEKAEKVK